MAKTSIPFESPRKWWRMHSLYVIGVLAFLPEIMAGLISQGWLDPGSEPVAYKIAAAIGFAARVYRANTPGPLPAPQGGT
jgi:hypothetical protein